MTVVTWDELAKNQTDNETIEQAISRLIQAHNDDPEAHLGAGQSLQSHKAAEIIDHLAGSVVGDKLSFSEGVMLLNFETVDSWTQEGTILLQGVASAELISYAGVAVDAQMYASSPFPRAPFQTDKSFTYQTTLLYSNNEDNTFNWGMGNHGTTPQPFSFGFYYDGTDLKAYTYDATTLNFSSPLTFAQDTFFTFRIQYDADNNVVHFLVNGTEVWQQTLATPLSASSFEFFYSLTPETVADTYIEISQLMFATNL